MSWPCFSPGLPTATTPVKIGDTSCSNACKCKCKCCQGTVQKFVNFGVQATKTKSGGAVQKRVLFSTKDLFLLLSTAQTRDNFWSNQYYKVDLHFDYEALAAVFRIEARTTNYAQLEQIMDTVTTGYRRAFASLSMTEAHGALKPNSVTASYAGLRCSCTDCRMLPWSKLAQLETHQWLHKPTDNFHCSVCYRRYFIQHTLLSHLSRRTKRNVTSELLENANYKKMMETQHQQEQEQLPMESAQVEQLHLRPTKRFHFDFIAETETTVALKYRKRSSLTSCAYCDYAYQYSFSYQLHMIRTHLQIPCSRRWHCYSCSRSFSTRRVYLNHLQRERRDLQQLVRKFKCNSCKRRFQLVRTLEQHIEQNHQRKVRCLICDLPSPTYCCAAHSVEERRAVFLKSRRLQAKNRSARRSELGLLPKTPAAPKIKKPCQLCDKKYPNDFLLKIHVKKVHLKQADFICDQCGKTCYSNKDLLTHNSTVHPKESVYCEICQLTIKARQNYKRHCNTVRHLEQLDKLQGKLPPKKKIDLIENFICSQCGKVFKNKQSLFMHNRSVHPKESVYCEICHTTIKSADNYKRHCDSAHHVEQLNKLAMQQGKLPPDAVIVKHMPHAPTIYCAPCDCYIRRNVNFQIHCESKKHKMMLVKHQQQIDENFESQIFPEL